MPELRDLAPMVWVVDADWRVLEPDEHKTCRRCDLPAVAQLYRRYGDELPRPWAYCGLHLYGREVIRGEVHIRVCADSLTARRGYSIDRKAAR